MPWQCFRDIELWSSSYVNCAARDAIRHGDDRRHGKPQELRFTRAIHQLKWSDCLIVGADTRSMIDDRYAVPHGELCDMEQCMG